MDSYDETQCSALGLVVAEPTLEQLDEEAAEPDPASKVGQAVADDPEYSMREVIEEGSSSTFWPRG